MRRAVEARQCRDIALNAGLCALPCLYIAFAMCLALALYGFLQPTRYPNPGVAAVEVSSGAVPFVLAPELEARSRGESIQQPDGSVSRLFSQGADALALGTEPRVEGKSGVEKRRNRMRPDRPNNTADLIQMRLAQPRARDTTDYPAQASFGSYRAGGNNRARGNYSGWDNYRAWDDYHAGSSYQPRSSRQPLSGYQSRH